MAAATALPLRAAESAASASADSVSGAPAAAAPSRNRRAAKARAQPLERRARLQRLAQHLAVELDDAHRAAVARDEDPFALQPTQGLPEQSSADMEPLEKALVDDRLAEADLTTQDHHADPFRYPRHPRHRPLDIAGPRPDSA
jgi:hypothetical protein